MTVLLSILFAALAVLWFSVMLISLRAVLALRDLPAAPTTAAPCPDGLPGVSVVIPARNEEERVETTVRGLLGQRSVRLDVIVVNDRSTDRTGEILDQLSRQDPRLRVIHNEGLPDGWIGQCYGLHLGGQRATGEWVLFTDADIWMTPDVVARAVRAAVAGNAAHLCLMPSQHKATLFGKAAMITLLLAVANTWRKVHTQPGAHTGFGAFNLVRADAYRQMGGHLPLRLEINNDGRLGLLLNRTGHRTLAFFAGRDVKMDLARTPAQFIRAMEKNAFSRMRFSLPAAGLVLTLSVLCLATPLGPFVAGVPGVAAAAMWLGYSVPAMMLARRCGWPLAAGLVTPIVLPVTMLTVINSIAVTLRQRGVRWRDRFYSLETLRNGMVR
jgi:hypothetical protein